MAVITRTIQSGERRNEVTEIQKALIRLGANIASAELFTATTHGTYGTTTQLAVAALMDRFGIKHFNMPIPFNAPLGRLLNIAVGAELGNSAALRQAVRESFDGYTDSTGCRSGGAGLAGKVRSHRGFHNGEENRRTDS